MCGGDVNEDKEKLQYFYFIVITMMVNLLLNQLGFLGSLLMRLEERPAGEDKRN